MRNILAETKWLSLLIFTSLTFIFAACEHEPELLPGTPEVCFDKEIMTIINSNCNVPGCHGSGGEAPGLSNYDEVMHFVTPGHASKSELHKVITANINSAELMPPKPKSMLTGSQIDVINIWIQQGAKHTNCP